MDLFDVFLRKRLHDDNIHESEAMESNCKTDVHEHVLSVKTLNTEY